MINEGIVNVSYIIATILFILALGGLSNQETARRGNWYGIIGMAIALLATLFGEVTANIDKLIVALLVGGSIGLLLARRVQMTQMPELVAILHSLVGVAAVAVGFANFMDHTVHFEGVDKTIHDIETYLGILIGAVTFTGSLIAFGKLRGTISGNPVLFPGQQILNALLGLAACFSGGGSGLDSDAVAANNRAVALMGQFDFEAARDVFAELVQRYPRNWSLQTNLAIATLNSATTSW